MNDQAIDASNQHPDEGDGKCDDQPEHCVPLSTFSIN